MRWGSGAEWMSANGWSVFVGNNASMNSRRFVWQLVPVALNRKVKVRRSSPQKLYWSVNFYICQKTNYPAVLVENFFQDYKDDVEFLFSDKGSSVSRICCWKVLRIIKRNIKEICRSLNSWIYHEFPALYELGRIQRYIPDLSPHIGVKPICVCMWNISTAVSYTHLRAHET